MNLHSECDCDAKGPNKTMHSDIASFFFLTKSNVGVSFERLFYIQLTEI